MLNASSDRERGGVGGVARAEFAAKGAGEDALLQQVKMLVHIEQGGGFGFMRQQRVETTHDFTLLLNRRKRDGIRC